MSHLPLSLLQEFGVGEILGNDMYMHHVVAYELISACKDTKLF